MKIRVNSGVFRGRFLSVGDQAGLRPTKSQLRKTLFNWLRPQLAGMRGLDLFCGTGILGVEALSNGAASMCFADKSKHLLHQLEKNIMKFNGLSASSVRFVPWCFPEPWQQDPQGGYDLIFLDPPFLHIDIEPCINWALANRLCAPKALIYVEASKSATLPDDCGFELIKRGVSSGVQCALLQKV